MSDARTMDFRGDPSRIVVGPLASTLFHFGAPLALGMGLQTTFNLVDAYLISRLEPDFAGPSLGAIGICDQIAAIGSIVSYGISTATAALVAQHQGRGDTRAAQRVAWQSMILVGVWSVVFAAIGIVGAEFVIHELVGAKGRVAELATDYLRVILGGSFSIFFLLQITTIQRALGSSKTPVALLLLANVLNLFLAVLLVYGPGDAPAPFAWGPPIAAALHLPRMRVQGAAWATIVARTVTLLPLLFVVARRFGIFAAQARGKVNAAIVREIGKIAWPSSAQLVLRISAMLVIHALVARAFTTQSDQTATTALGIVFRLETMALFVGLGWGSAAQTFVGQNLGAGAEQRAALSGWIAAFYNLCAMALLMLVYRDLGLPIVRFFDEDPGVVAVALGYLSTIAPSYLALGVGIVLGSAMTGAGATRTTMLIDLGVIAGFELPLAIGVVSMGARTPSALWLVVAATNFLSAVVYAVHYRRGAYLRSTALGS
jgi:putative MATE family efflux protein